ncbi:HotDog domain-containing protein [Hypoxylon sp. FL1284]|nr:HotDog domain-containing protein [Hypoxylon sp. FL1284]
MLAGPRAGQLCRRAVSGARCIRVPPVHASSITIPPPICRIILPDSSTSSRHSLPSTKTRLFTTSRPCSAAPLPPPPQTTPTPTPTPNNNNPPRRRLHRGVYHGALFLLLGISLGTLLRHALTPGPPPAPGSPADAALTSQIRADGESLPLVRALAADPALTSWDAYSGVPRRAVPSRITSGPLGSSSGLPFQRVFHDAATGELTSVVYLGPGTVGWPGLVHGGALATVLDESLGRCAILRFPARTGVTARLELAYRRPTVAGRYYVVRARPAEGEKDEDPAKSDRKMWVQGTLETLDGRVCVRAKALFVVPKGVKLQPLVEGF